MTNMTKTATEKIAEYRMKDTPASLIPIQQSRNSVNSSIFPINVQFSQIPITTVWTGTGLMWSPITTSQTMITRRREVLTGLTPRWIFPPHFSPWLPPPQSGRAGRGGAGGAEPAAWFVELWLCRLRSRSGRTCSGGRTSSLLRLREAQTLSPSISEICSKHPFISVSTGLIWDIKLIWLNIIKYRWLNNKGPSVLVNYFLIKSLSEHSHYCLGG